MLESLWISLKASGRIFREEFFGSGPQTLLTAFETFGVLVGAFGLYSGLPGLTEDFDKAGSGQLTSYLWFTYVGTSVLTASTILLAHRLLAASRRRNREYRLECLGLRLQHQMAEQVRLAAVVHDEYDFSTQLESVCSELREYLRDRLQLSTGTRVHITIKRIRRPGGAEGERKLEAIFRDQDQDKSTRERRELESLSGNYIYETFKDATKFTSKQIYVDDTEEDRPQSSFTKLGERGRARGYRSVLAFPMNRPIPQLTGNTRGEAENLIGFLGIDSDLPRAFDDLFRAGKTDELSSDGLKPSHKRATALPREELNLLYGLTDAAATILILMEDERRSTNCGEGEHSNGKNRG